MATRKPVPRDEAASSAVGRSRRPPSSGEAGGPTDRRLRAASGGSAPGARAQNPKVRSASTEAEPERKAKARKSGRASKRGAAPAPSADPQVDAVAGSDARRTARVIAIANQKGGVGKSTTAVSLGAALAELGYRVLVLDLDPQGNASTGMGIRHEAREVTVYDVLASEGEIERAIVPTVVEGLDAVPSTIDLAGAEIELVSQFSREMRLKKALEPLTDGHYDFIFLDCPPSLGLLTINALAAAEELIVPIQCEYYALEGLGQLLRNVRLVQQNVNPRLRLTGIVLTMFDPRTKLSEQVVQEVRRYFGERVYDVVIPRTVRLSEAPGYGQPITQYDSRSRGAETYRELAKEVVERPIVSDPLPSLSDLPTVTAPPPTSQRNARSPTSERGGAEEASDAPTPPPRDEVEAATAPSEPPASLPPAAETGASTEPGGEVESPPAPAEEPADEQVARSPAAETQPDVEVEEAPAPPPRAEPVAAAPMPAPELEPDASAATTRGAEAASERASTEAPAEDEQELEEEIAYADVRQGQEAPPRSRAARGERPPHVVVIDDMSTLGDQRRSADEAADASSTATSMEGSTMGSFEEPPRKRRWRLFRKGGDEG